MALKKEDGGEEGRGGGGRLSSARPWWDLCRGARYTAFSRAGGERGGGGGGVFMLLRGWELLIFSKTEFSSTRIERMDHT